MPVFFVLWGYCGFGCPILCVGCEDCWFFCLGCLLVCLVGGIRMRSHVGSKILFSFCGYFAPKSPQVSTLNIANRVGIAFEEKYQTAGGRWIQGYRKYNPVTEFSNPNQSLNRVVFRKMEMVRSPGFEPGIISLEG